jgi:hypothetical protein
MLLARVNYTIEAQWAEVASEAMTTYAIATAMSKDPSGADLAPHVKTLRSHLRRTSGSNERRSPSRLQKNPDRRSSRDPRDPYRLRLTLPGGRQDGSHETRSSAAGPKPGSDSFTPSSTALPQAAAPLFYWLQSHRM